MKLDSIYEKSQRELEIDQHYKLMREAIDWIREDARKRNRRTPKKIEVMEFMLNEWELYRSVKEYGNPVREISKPEIYKFALHKFKKQITDKGETKEQLIENIAHMRISMQILKELNQHNYDSYHRVMSKFIDLQDKVLKGGKSRVTKRNKLHEEDNKRLLECLDELKKNVGRPLVRHDLLPFIRLVKRKYPEQLYIQKPRLTREERSLSKEDQAFILEDKVKRRGAHWADSRLSDFFNSSTGLKGTTKFK